MKDLKARSDEIALEALKQYVANRTKAAERAERLGPNSRLARTARELLQKARGEYDDFVARVAATDLTQDDVPAPTAALVEASAVAATVRVSSAPTEASVPPASPTVPPPSQADLTYGRPSLVQAPAPTTNRAEDSPPKTSVVESSSIELAALPAAARTVEPVAPEDSSTEGNVARVLATLKTVFQDRLSSAPEARRDEQAAASQPPARDPPRDRQHPIGAVASPLEQMPLKEGAAVSNEQTEESSTTGQHEGFPLRFEEQLPVQAQTSSSPASGALRDVQPTFGAIVSPPDGEAAAITSTDLPAERWEVSGTVEEQDDATAPFVQQELTADLAQDDVPAPTAASVEAAAVAATVRASSAPSEASVPPASPTVPPARRVDLTDGQSSPVQAPAPTTNRAEVSPPKTSVVERPSIERAALPVAARTVEPAASEDSSAEGNVARVRVTLRTVFRNRLSSAPAARRDEQAAAPQPPVRDPPGDRQHAISAVASPLEQMPLEEGAAISTEQTEASRTIGQREDFPLRFEEQPPVQIASPADEEAAANTSTDVPGERWEVSGTVEEHDDATAPFAHQELAADLALNDVPAPIAASVEAAAVTASVWASSSPTEASAPPASPTVPPTRQFDLAYGRAPPVHAPLPMTDRAEVPPASALIVERSLIEPAALPSVADAAEPAAPEDSTAEMNVSRALATLSSVFREQLSPAPETRRDKQAATSQREASETVEAHVDTVALFDQPELAAVDAASDAAVSADQAVTTAERLLHDMDALTKREFEPESGIIRKPEDPALSTDQVLLQNEEGSLADPGRQSGATGYDEPPGDRGFSEPRVFDTEEALIAPSQDEYLDSFDQGNDEEPATTHPDVARDQPVSAPKTLPDDLPLQEAPTTSEQPTAEEQPRDRAAAPMLSADPKLDAFESWLKHWRAGLGT